MRGLLCHEDLEKCVGDALASFVYQLSIKDSTVPPGVYFAEEVPGGEFRKSILNYVTKDASLYEIKTFTR